MINYPITYHPGYFNDLIPIKETGEQTWAKVKRIALAAIPLIGLHRPFRGPLSGAMSALRSLTHANEFISCVKQADNPKALLHFLHTVTATAAVALYFFNPLLCFIVSTLQDGVINVQDLIVHIQKKEYQLALESLAFLTLNVLFLASFCYGAIQITVACMLVQVALDLYHCAKHVKNGEYFEAVCSAILGGAHLQAAIPQCKLLAWTLKHGGAEFTAELKQNAQGFVYLDVPNEYVYELFGILGETGTQLPPYFGKGAAGAHISVILAKQNKNFQISEIGKKFTFRIAHTDTLRAGAKSVSFLTVVCPELEGLRARYGLNPRIGGDHDFHLTYAVKV